MIWSVKSIEKNSLLGKEKFLDGVKHLEEIISGEQFNELHVLDMFCHE